MSSARTLERGQAVEWDVLKFSFDEARQRLLDGELLYEYDEIFRMYPSGGYVGLSDMLRLVELCRAQEWEPSPGDGLYHAINQEMLEAKWPEIEALSAA